MFNKSIFFVLMLCSLLLFSGCSKSSMIAVLPTQNINNSTFIIANTSGDTYLYNPSNYSIRFNDSRLNSTILNLISSSPSGGDITAIIAGIGLYGGGVIGNITINANTSYLQRRVNYSCSVGSSIRVINQDGSVTCETDSTGGSGTVTSITAGIGLTGGTIINSGTIALNNTYTEKLAHRTPSEVLFEYDGESLSNITNVYNDRNVTTLFTYNNSQLVNIYKIDDVLGDKNITFVYNGTTLIGVVYS